MLLFQTTTATRAALFLCSQGYTILSDSFIYDCWQKVLRKKEYHDLGVFL